jgi:hypothetical protein
MEQRIIEVTCEILFPHMMKIGMTCYTRELEASIQACWSDAKAELNLKEGRYPCLREQCDTVRILTYASHYVLI